MQRRKVLAYLGATAISAPVVGWHAPIQSLRPREAIAFATSIERLEAVATERASVNFRWTSEEGIRSVHAQVSSWTYEVAASDFQDEVMASGGSDLPEGEFYQTDPEIIPLTDAPEGVNAQMVGWTTIVGVAAFTTGYALLTVRKANMLWTVVVSASSLEEAANLAASLIPALVEKVPPPCSSLDGYLPDESNLPDGAIRDDIVEQEATENNGLLIPEVPLATPAVSDCTPPE